MATTASRLRDPAIKLAYYVRIEGIGYFESGTSKSLYLFSELPDWTASGTQKFIDGLHVPSGVNQSIDAIGGVESPSSLDLEFDEYFAGATYQSSPVWASLFASSRAIFDASTDYPVTYITAPLNRTATSVAVEDTASFPTAGQIFIGNECATYTGKTATTFTGLSRGRHPVETGREFAYYHRFSEDTSEATESRPIVSTVPFTWYNRKVGLYVFHRDQDGTWGTEAESLLVWKGRIQTRAWDGQRWRFACRGILSDLERAIFSVKNDPRATVGFFVTQNTSLSLPTRHTSVVVDGSTADSYNFTLSSEWFSSYQGLARSLINAFKDSAPGDGQPYVKMYGTEDGNFYVGVGAPGISTSLDIHWAQALKIVLRENNADTLPATTTITGGAFADDKHTFVSIHPAGAVSLPVNHGTSTLRIVNARGLVTNQNETGSAFSNVGYGVLKLGDAGSVVCRITAISTASNPHTADVRIVAGDTSLLLPSMRELITSSAVVGSYGPAELKQAFVPYFSDGLGPALLRMMTSTGFGNNQDVAFANYDVLPEDYGAGIDAYDIDIQAFIDLDVIFGDLARKVRYLITRPTPLKDLLDQIAKFLGVMFVANTSGKISVREAPRFGYVGQTSITLDESNQDKPTDRPTYTESPDTTYNTITVRTDWDEADGNFVDGGGITLVDTQSKDLFQKGRDLKIEHKGVRSSLTLSDIAQLQVQRLMMFRFPQPRVDRTLTRDLWNRIALGDRVRFDDRTFPNPFTGAYGATQLVGFVERLSTDYRGRNGRVSLRLFVNDHAAPIAPSAFVTAYDDAVTLTVAANEFGGDGAGGNDAQIFQAGDVIYIGERNPADVATADSWQRTVVSVTATTIVLNTALSAPLYDAAKEYFVTFADYTSAVAGQRTRGTFQANSANHRIQLTQDFYVYF